LERYERKHARIFFGRSPKIRALYDKIIKPESPPLILLYGQSGVGKSSLLEAGLLPRLEGSHNVIYKRRNKEKGLLGTLAAEGELKDLWKQIESRTGKPLVVLLDQVEEVFTDSNKDLPNELENFTAALRTIFNNPENYPQGRLILGYRKEFNPEIEDKLKEAGFS
jgi:Cdc6-like AAA superfamily ATPase